MSLNYNIFLHETDKNALNALKAIPGFTQLLKSYMKAWNEKLFYIQNMSTFVHITDQQLGKYQEMLLPICKKLDIEVPDLFLQLNPYPNSYTSGDTKPFIVMTSGLLETLPERLIPTVLAHECGHIACHHVLYRTMGQMILNGALFTLLGQGVSALLTQPIRAAFYYWMRCSEFSADRAAILCDGSPDNMMEVCARLAGFGKGIGEPINMEAFMKQAEEYRQLINENPMNKTMEFMAFGYSTHPLNAVRAYEASAWASSEQFIKARNYCEAYQRGESSFETPLLYNEKHYLNHNYQEVLKELEEQGLKAGLSRSTEKNTAVREGGVISVSIDDSHNYKEDDWVRTDAKVEVEYYQPLTNEEIALQHPGQICMPQNYIYYIGKDYKEVERELMNIGLPDITLIPQKDIRKESDRALHRVSALRIDGKSKFSKGSWFDIMSDVIIIYHEMAD
ncbi:MAG: M48 family metallopeptidase [Erysipelotrichaceae bacterium]|nr:M48 family metallopeptidase [Erysipelotrichaceae bacterium]